MPKVGNKKFPYTKAGMKAAKKAAKDTDQEVQYKMGGGYMMRNKPIAMKDGGSLKMVKNSDGVEVPFYAADGKGKMADGGQVKPKARPKDLEKKSKKAANKRIIKESVRRRTRDHNTEPKKDIKSALGLAYGGKVKKMRDGGSCRGMGAASKGGKFRMA